MKSYGAAFSASFHLPWPHADSGTHGTPVPPSVYFLSLFDLLGSLNVFTPDNPRGLDGTKKVDAALRFENPSTVYLFQGGSCYRVSIAEPTGQSLDSDTNAQPIKSVFGYDFGEGNGKEFFFDSIDATLHSPKNHKILFFRGIECESVGDLDFEPDHWKNPSVSGNVPTISGAWPNLPDNLTQGITWAATQIGSDDGAYRESAYLSNGADLCAVTPSTNAPSSFTVIFTERGDHPVSAPTNVSRITVELWGPGGKGGDGGSGYGAAVNGGGNGGAGAHIKQVITPAPPSQVTVHVGGQGEYSCYPAQNPTLVAGGGGGGGGDGTFDGYGYGYGGDGDGGGNSGAGHAGKLGGHGAPVAAATVVAVPPVAPAVAVPKARAAILRKLFSSRAPVGPAYSLCIAHRRRGIRRPEWRRPGECRPPGRYWRRPRHHRNRLRALINSSAAGVSMSRSKIEATVKRTVPSQSEASAPVRRLGKL